MSTKEAFLAIEALIALRRREGSVPEYRCEEVPPGARRLVASDLLIGVAV